MMDTKRLKKTILLLADAKGLQKERNEQKEADIIICLTLETAKQTLKEEDVHPSFFFFF